MKEKDVTYRYDAFCEHCDNIQLTTSNEPFTVPSEVKEQYGTGAPTDHDCEFTRFEEIEPPLTKTVTYE